MREIKLKTGRAWQITYYDNGKRETEYWPGLNKQDALSKKAEIENLMRLKTLSRKAGKYQDVFGYQKRPSMSLRDFLLFFEGARMEEVKAGSIALVTLKRQLYAFRLFIDIFQDLDIGDVSPAAIEQYKTERAKHISSEGVNKDLQNLKVVLRFAFDKGLLPVEVYKRVRPFKVVKELPAIFAPDEIDIIEKFMHPDLALFAFQIIKYTGVRRAEVVKIRWCDVRKDYIILPHTKTRRQRTIPLFSKLADIIEERRRMIEPDQNEKLVDANPCTITRWFNAAMKDAGLYMPGNAVHIIRHSLGAYLAAKGFGLNEIAQTLGHESLQMAKFYSQINKAALKDRLDEAWKKR